MCTIGILLEYMADVQLLQAHGTHWVALLVVPSTLA